MSRNVGFMSSAGFSYKLTHHWGIGADILWLNSSYSRPEGWKDSYGYKHVGSNCGMSYHF